MDKRLLHEIENFKLLSGYNTKNTLSENIEILKEETDLLNETGGVMKTLVQGYGDDVIKGLSSELKAMSMFGKSADAAESFLRNLRSGKATTKQLGQFSDELLRNKQFAGGAKGELGQLQDLAAESYVKKLLNSTDDAAVKFKNASAQDRVVMLKDRGYNGASIQKINKKYDELAQSGIKPKPKPNEPLTAQERLAQKRKTSTTPETTTPTTPAATTPKGRIQKAKEAVIKYKDNLLNSLKTKGWKKTLAVAAGLGITGAILWQFAKDNGVQSEGQPEQQPQDTPVTGYGSGSSSSTSYEIPSELVDVKGVQDFQTWLDTNKPGWHSKYQTLGGNVQRGFGKFGPNTNRAWQDEEIKKAYLASKGQQNPSQEEPIPTKRELEQPVKLDRPDRNTQISNQIPQNLSTQAPTFQAPQTDLTPQQQRKVERMRNRQQQ